ncbi:MAG: hypothetical protein IGS23_09335 [Rivularia sp. T60_A2020_040]|nr:hypothetical protein [Rivularia sp. T60_A2020_040]
MNSKNGSKTSINFVEIFLATATIMAATVAPALAAPKVRIVDNLGYGANLATKTQRESW